MTATTKTAGRSAAPNRHPQATLVHELSQRFFFDAAHTLARAGAHEAEAEASRRIHGHTYQARVTVRGGRPLENGMVVDLAVLRAATGAVRARLDHRLLEEVVGLGAPTLENLCSFVYRELEHRDWIVVAVEIGRESSGDACRLRVEA